MTRTFTVSALCGLFLLFAFALSLGMGSSEVGLIDFLQLILYKCGLAFGPEREQAQWDWLARILLVIRLPRTCVAALCGGALAVAGVVSQGLFRNPLASPVVLGTTSGASFLAAVAFYSGLASYAWYSLPLAASLGAFFATSFLFLLMRQGVFLHLEHLLLAGFALSSFLGALTSFVISLSLSDYEKTAAMMHWLLGGFSGRGWQHFAIGVGPIVIAIVLALRMANALNLLALGEDIAHTLSLPLDAFKKLALLLISLLVGASVSMAGSLPFIGLVVPHITRSLVGADHRRLLIVSMINGMSLTMLADLLARTVRAPLEIEVGVFTALIGAPFFLLILWRRRQSSVRF